MTEFTRLQSIAREAIDSASIARSARIAREVQSLLQSGDEKQLSGTCLRIAVLRDFTIEPLLPILTTALAAEGILAEFEPGMLGAVFQEAVSESSFLYRGGFDACLVASTPGCFPQLPGDDSFSGRADPFQEALRQLDRRFSGSIHAFNHVLPATSVMPRLQSQVGTSPRYVAELWNRALAESLTGTGRVSLCDLEQVRRRLGETRFWSPRDWATSMQPWSPEALFAIAGSLASTIVCGRRTPVKCIVLDCDNTLWGGVVGEAGVSGIALGETYPGVCFEAFQQQLRSLNRHGFLLALNSKNNEPDVREVFETHPRSVLKWQDFAAVRVNWDDKASNLTGIAAELNIGVDSLLFIDDSDYELTWVRQQLPEVESLKTPPETWRLPALLPECARLDRLRITAEDLAKSAMYVSERERKALRSGARSFDDFLRDLQLNLTSEPFDPAVHLQRAAQLTQKTNQFNLTTRRYTETELLEMVDAGARIALGSLTDRFGDYGRIALAIFRPVDAGRVSLDTFLMSCRAMGRQVEFEFLRSCLRELADAGVRLVEAEYIPTAKNQPCADFLEQFGFSPGTTRADGGKTCLFELTRERLEHSPDDARKAA